MTGVITGLKRKVEGTMLLVKAPLRFKYYFTLTINYAQSCLASPGSELIML